MPKHRKKVTTQQEKKADITQNRGICLGTLPPAGIFTYSHLIWAISSAQSSVVHFSLQSFGLCIPSAYCPSLLFLTAPSIYGHNAFPPASCIPHRRSQKSRNSHFLMYMFSSIRIICPQDVFVQQIG